jgi:phosphatidylglycerol:prolipoprotein diacylglycerol transferase
MPLFALPFPAIDPVLIAIGPFAIRWYALAYIVGIFIGWWYARRLVGNERLWGPAGPPMKPADMDDFVVWAAIGIIAGGRLGYVLFYDLPVYLANPWQILEVWHGGMSFHGGFLGTVLAMILFARSRGFSLWSLFDVIGPSVTFGLFLGRLANFNNGELWGRVTDVPWGMVFCNDYIIAMSPDHECPAGFEPRHPSQLYEAVLEGIVLFLVLRLLTHRYHKLAKPGVVAGAFLTGYGVARTFSEFFRQPDIQIGYLAGGLTEGMLLSIPMILAGVAIMLWAARRPAASAVEKA